MATPIKKPSRPLNEMLRIFAAQAEEQLKINLITQRIWPYEVYPGYAEENERRKARGEWYSTGEGAKSFSVQVENASSVWDATIVARFNAYLRYVDIGVGAGRHAEDVQRSRKAKFDKRYITKWDVKGRRTHRPAIFMELRHMGKRMRDFAVDFYGYEGMDIIIPSFEKNPIEIKV